MPKTKLDRFARRALTKSEKDAMIVRLAFAKVHIFKQSEMAKAIGASEHTICVGLKKGFSPKSIARIHEVVGFNPEELEALLCK